MKELDIDKIFNSMADIDHDKSDKKDVKDIKFKSDRDRDLYK